MHPVNFDNATHEIGRPKGTTEKQCRNVQAFIGKNASDQSVVITQWQVTPEDLKEIERTGFVWVSVWGETMPPIMLHAQTPF